MDILFFANSVKSCAVKKGVILVPDGVIEEHGVLRHNTDLPADRALSESLDVLAVEEELEDLDNDNESIDDFCLILN